MYLTMTRDNYSAGGIHGITLRICTPELLVCSSYLISIPVNLFDKIRKSPVLKETEDFRLNSSLER